MYHFPKQLFTWGAIFALFFAFSGNLRAQFRDAPPSATKKISLDEFSFFRDDLPRDLSLPRVPGLEGEKPVSVSHKSPFVAGVLSFILPGLGEYYIGDHIWRGIIFTALDAALLYGELRYNARYNDSLTAFYNYGYSHFSPVFFADSLNTRLALSGRTNFRIDTNKVAEHDFSDINKALDSLDIFGFPNMTHHLPDYGSYDYQEVASKYEEFVFGWDDYFAGGPKYSPNYEQHAVMEANTNHQSDIASYFVWGMFVNRVLSVIDAVLLAHDHNSAIHLEGELKINHLPGGMFGYIPTAKLRYTF